MYFCPQYFYLSSQSFDFEGTWWRKFLYQLSISLLTFVCFNSRLRRVLLHATLSWKVCQLLATDRRFYSDSSTTRIGRHDISEIMTEVSIHSLTLNIHNPTTIVIYEHHISVVWYGILVLMKWCELLYLCYYVWGNDGPSTDRLIVCYGHFLIHNLSRIF